MDPTLRHLGSLRLDLMGVAYAEERRFGMQSADGPLRRSPSLVVAVFPFRFHGEETLDEILVDGFCDEIVNRLSKIADLHVISHESMSMYRNSPEVPVTIAKGLGADRTLTGAVTERSGKLSLSVKLTDVHSGFLTWSERFSFAADRLLENQAIVSDAVAEALPIDLTLPRIARALAGYPHSVTS